MKASELRQSILQAAVQGRLVPQDSHDEPASKLLERIKSEKAKLNREGKAKREQPLPPILEEELPNDLPDGWVWCRVADVCIINPRNKLPDNLNVAFTPMSCISRDYFGGHSQEMRTWGTVKNGFTHYAENDVVIAKITPCFQNGKSCIMKRLTNGFGAGTTELHVLRCLAILPEYLLIFVKSPSFLLDGEQNMTGTAGQQRVPTEYIRKCLFPLPPHDEQKRIIAKVNMLMSLCDELEATEKELEALESHFIEYLPKSVLQMAVQGKLVSHDIHDEPASILLDSIRAEKAKLIREGKLKNGKPMPPIAEDEIPYDLPEEWVWCRLGDIIQLADNNNIHENLPQDAIVNYVDIDAIDNKKYCIRVVKQIPVKDLSTRARRVLHKGYIMYSLVRPYLNNIAVVTDNKENHIGSTGFVVFKPISIALHYIIYFLLSPIVEERYLSILSGFNSPSISLDDFQSTPFPLPPLAEQQRIIVKLDELMSLCDGLKAAKSTPIIRESPSNIIPFPQPSNKPEKLGMVARGDGSQGLSEKARFALLEMLEEDDDA